MLCRETFSALILPEQITYVQALNVYLATRYEPGYIINLYSLKHFYAEVWHETQCNQPVKVTTFTKNKGLRAYVKFIKTPPDAPSLE